MFVAVDTIGDTAVSGLDVNTAVSHQPEHSDGSRYHCLFCGDPVAHNNDPDDELGYFSHSDEPCIGDGNASSVHRLGQEMVAKTIFEILPTGSGSTQIELERKIGSRSSFIIADVRVSEPIHLAVEVLYLSAGLDLHRRLQTLFEEGYAGMIVALTTGLASPMRIEKHLKKIGDIHVGRFDPYRLDLLFGSIVSPERVNLDSSSWDRLPAYLT